MNTTRGSPNEGARLCPSRTSRSGPESSEAPVEIGGISCDQAAAAGAPHTQPRSGENPRGAGASALFFSAFFPISAVFRENAPMVVARSGTPQRSEGTQRGTEARNAGVFRPGGPVVRAQGVAGQGRSGWRRGTEPPQAGLNLAGEFGAREWEGKNWKRTEVAVHATEKSSRRARILQGCSTGRGSRNQSGARPVPGRSAWCGKGAAEYSNDLRTANALRTGRPVPVPEGRRRRLAGGKSAPADAAPGNRAEWIHAPTGHRRKWPKATRGGGDAAGGRRQKLLRCPAGAWPVRRRNRGPLPLRGLAPG